MPHTFEVGVKGVIINPRNNTVLFLTSIDDKGNTILEFPGGRMEEGETIEQTVQREISEEISNIGAIKVGRILSANPRSFNLKNGNGLMLMSVLVEADVETPILSNEHTGYFWLTKEDLTGNIPLKVGDATLDNHAYLQAALTALNGAIE